MLLDSRGQRPQALLPSYTAECRPNNKKYLASMSIVLRLQCPD